MYLHNGTYNGKEHKKKVKKKQITNIKTKTKIFRKKLKMNTHKRKIWFS